MATPNSRQTLKDFCLRQLGHPVLEINVDDDQLEDRIDDALQVFQDYHFDGTQKLLLKHKVTGSTMNQWEIAIDLGLRKIPNCNPCLSSSI